MNFETFKTKLAQMNHRERLCYPLVDNVKDKYKSFYAHTVEVYMTVLLDVKGSPKNLNVKISTVDGKVVKNEEGKTLFNKSKYLCRCSDDYLKTIYNLIEKENDATD